jgi:hypothetical protein
MHEDWNRILEEHHAIQAGGTLAIRSPLDTWLSFVHFTMGLWKPWFPHNYESDAKAIASHVSQLDRNLHYALTEKIPEFRNQEYMDHTVVVTNHVYKLDDTIKTLWEDKSPKVFDAFVGQLTNEIRAHESEIIPFPELSPTTYDGYQAILGNVRVVASVSSLLSELSLRLAFLSFQGHSAFGPVGSRLQRTPVHHYLHPTLTRKAYLLLLANHGLLPYTW